MNRRNIYDAVKLIGARPNMSDTDLTLILGIVQGELNRTLYEHPNNFNRTTLTLPTEDTQGDPIEDNTDILAIPSNLRQLVTLRQDDQLYEVKPATVELTDYTYRARGQVYEICPSAVPGTQFQMDYYAKLNDLVADSDINWVSTDYPDVYIYGMLVQVATMTKTPENLASWGVVYKNAVAELYAQGWNQNIGARPAVMTA